MRRTASLFVAAAAVLLGSCAQDSGPAAPTAAAASAPAAETASITRTSRLEAEDVVASATGSGHVSAANGELRKFAFSAVKRADGSVSGQYELVAGNADLVAHGTVTCLTVIGDQAWIGGTLDRNSIGAPFDTGRFRVVDNVEATSSAPDELSLLFIAVDPTGQLAAEYCEDTPEFPPLNPIEQGSIQVR